MSERTCQECNGPVEPDHAVCEACFATRGHRTLAQHVAADKRKPETTPSQAHYALVVQDEEGVVRRFRVLGLEPVGEGT